MLRRTAIQLLYDEIDDYVKYTALGAYFADKGFDNVARAFYDMALDEYGHAVQFLKLLNVEVGKEITVKLIKNDDEALKMIVDSFYEEVHSNGDYEELASKEYDDVQLKLMLERIAQDECRHAWMLKFIANYLALHGYDILIPDTC